VTPGVWGRRRYVLLVIVLVAAVAGVVAFSAISFLERAAMNEERARLTEQARSEARVLEAITQNQVSEGQSPNAATDQAIAQVNEALSGYKPAAATGDIQIARREGNNVVFLVQQRSNVGLPAPAPFGGKLAAPMQRALSGLSGTMIGLDYRGVRVLAAYEPVPTLGLGVVAKVDLAELRAPFRTAVFLALGPILGVLLLGGGALLLLNRPLIHRARQVEREYEDLVATLGEGVIVQDRDARIVYVNLRLCEMLGYSSEELVGRPTAELFAAESRERFALELEQRRRGQSNEYDAVMARRDGTPVFVLVAARAKMNRHDEFDGSFGVVTDVTELRRQGDRLTHLNLILRAIRNVNQLITRETDRDRLLDEVCRELVATEGVLHVWIAQLDASGRAVRGAQAGIGPAFDVLRDHLLRGELPACCQRALAAGRPVVFRDPRDECTECPGRIAYPDTAAVATPLRHEGMTLGVLVAAVPQAWAEDAEERSLLLEVASDVAFALHDLDEADALRAAEAALRESEIRYRSLFENAVLGVYLTAPTGEILAANPALVTMLGYASFEELAKRNLETKGHVVGYSRSEFKARMERDGRVAGLESAWTRKDGSVVHVRENATALRDAGGRVFLYEGTVEDITARREAEEARRHLEARFQQSQRLESIGTLASGVAHEINNPLTGIINYAQLILERTDSDSLRDFAQGIVDEGNRVATIVRNLLAFSRQQKESHSPARIPDIASATLSLIGAALRRDGIDVVIDIPDGLPTIKCRSQQIQQVLLNLLTNARDALNARFPSYDERKRIRITAGEVSHDGRAWVHLTVEDAGIGIPADLLERIFDPFFTTKPRDQGTGLGLSISYGIVRDHHGTISVESEPNEVTRFVVELPVDNGWNLAAQSGDRPTEVI